MAGTSSADYERLGAFYLGKRRDLKAGETLDELVLYDSKDLTTHAVCVGMTGSGKTGLCLSLLEEAAIDGIPVIAIDPKGDLGNLMLTFPGLQPADFEPWIDPAQATRKGKTVSEYASSVSELWANGLNSWGQDGKRIQRLRDSAEFSIYTPGSSAGLSLSIIKSFSVPPTEVMEDSDALRDKIASSAASLLGLLGINGDPITSREHILLSNIFESNWKSGKSLALADLIMQIQKPPFDRVGVLDLETFYSEKDRRGLSMMVNNLLASPTFAGWMDGDALDVQKLMYTSEGKPRVSILSIAHLSDSERMFFVTLLLNEVLGWMRSQAGTSSLRAILYMDEVFGYFPPTANPPSKTPMLTLLKQARAFGLGVVLATQNPVDLDYKGLSNTGTWFLGRLQTERDKMRVLEGLEGASAGSGTSFNRAAMEETLAGLGSRVFLLHNVHDDEPTIFETRWAMSYLRGPLTRNQIKILMEDRKQNLEAAKEKQQPAVNTPQQIDPVVAQKSPAIDSEKAIMMSIPSDIQQIYLPTVSKSTENRQLVYRPRLFAVADAHFKRVSLAVDDWRTIALIADVSQGSNQLWRTADFWIGRELATDEKPLEPSRHEAPPSDLIKSKNFSSWQKKFVTHVYQQQRLVIWESKELKTISKPGETLGDFRGRLATIAREQRDIEVEKLRERYASKLATIQGRLQRAEQKVAEQAQQYRAKSMDTVVSIGSTLLGAVFGKKLGSRTNVTRAGSSMKSVGRAAKERGDVTRAKEDVHKYQKELAKLEKEFQSEIKGLEQRIDPSQIPLTSVSVSPTKSDTNVRRFAILWMPWWVTPEGIAEPAWNVNDIVEQAIIA